MRAINRRDLVLLLALIAVAAAVRFIRLGTPDTLVFDEVYYAQDACSYLGWGAQVCGVAHEASFVHPPLGKWLIALGISLFGNDPVGWRIMPALAGTAMVGFVVALALLLTRSRLAALVAGGFLALDPLSIVQSRVGMLDVFTACAGVVAVTFAVLDRERRRAGGSAAARRLKRPWLIAAGLAGGVAIATKWSGGLVLAAVILLVLAWELSETPGNGGRRAALRRALPAVLLWLVVLPAAIYVASYAGRLEGDLLRWPWDPDGWWRQFAGRQLRMLQFHVGLDQTHRAASPAWSWLLGKRAIVYFFETDAAGRYREVLAFANPLLWVPAALAAAWAGLLALRRRSWWGAEATIGLCAAAAYLPWLVLTIGRPFVFFYYVVPTIPFLALAAGWAVTRLSPRLGRGVGVAILAASVAITAYWSPLIYALPLDYDAWRTRMVFTDCGPGARAPNGRLQPFPTVAEPPPAGWCWV